MADEVFPEKEAEGGETVGFRRPGEGPSPEPPEEVLEEKVSPEDEEETPPISAEAEVEEVDISTEGAVLKLEVEDLDLLIDQEEFSIDKSLSADEKRQEVLKALGYEVTEKVAEPPKLSPEESMDRDALLRENALLKMQAQLVDEIEANPQEVIRELAQSYGVNLGTPAAQPGPPQAGVKVPELEPQGNESMAQYLQRVIQAVEDQRAAQPPAQPVHPVGPGPRPRNPQVGRTINYLTKYYPDWGQYERKMVDMIRVDPSLLGQPDELYRRASGGRTPGKREASTARRVTLKRGGPTGERGGRGPRKTAVKGRKLRPGSASDFRTAWDDAKRRVAEGEGV